VAWFADGEDAWLIVASGGTTRHTAWHLNLVAHPDRASIEPPGLDAVPVTPHVLDGAEREQAWERITAARHRYAKYQRKSDREFPVVRLSRQRRTHPAVADHSLETHLTGYVHCLPGHVSLVVVLLRAQARGLAWHGRENAKEVSMDIAVIGTGKIGRTLGEALAAAGHHIRFGSRTPEESVREALEGAEAVIVAIPGESVGDLAGDYADELAGKVVIDAANKFGDGPAHSAAEFAGLAPTARYVRAFNALGWENFADPVFDGVVADLFYSAEEADRETVERLIRDIGLNPVYLGPEQHDLLDQLLKLWFTLATGQRRGRHLAFKVLYQHDPVPDPAHQPTVFEWAGGLPALTRMTRIFYRKYVPEDPLLSPLFAQMSPDHPERVAAWLGETFGGPKTYSERYGSYDRMVSRHVGRALSEEQRARWVQLLCKSADDAKLPTDPEWRAAFASYLEWGSRIALENSQPGAHPPPHMPVPRWSWVNDATPGSRVSALAAEAPAASIELPGIDESVSFEQHLRPLFRELDRTSMRFAFDLWNHADVATHADAILERLQAGTMPCDRAWSAEKVELFRRWAESERRA
jgi:deazaflavin-dependent oxidoreductase (nitroreductase family)